MSAIPSFGEPRYGRIFETLDWDNPPMPRMEGGKLVYQDDVIDDAVRRAWGDEALAEHRRLNATFHSGEYMVDSLGGHANRFVKDARVMKLTDKYDLVYWGGKTVESLYRWNFHISKASPGKARVAGQARTFDADAHKAVNLKRERIRVVIQTDRNKYVALLDRKMILQEGATAYLEEVGPRNRKVLTPFLLPRRVRDDLPPGTVVLPA